MKKISLLIFDLDGTLIDSKIDITNCVLWTLRDMGLSSIPAEVIHSYVGNGVRPLIQKSVEAAHGSSFDKAIRIFEGYYRAHLIDQTRPFPGVQETLEHFRSKKMAVCTNKPQYFTEPILSGLKLSRYFMAVIGSGTAFPKKPDPTMIFHLLKESVCRPEEAVLIGDSRVDIETGKNAGVLTCGVTYGFRPSEEVREANADFVIDDLLELKSIFE